MFYSFKDCSLTIENKSFIARDLELTTQADVVPVYNVSSPFNTNYAANNGLQGILKFSYYLTGNDPIKPYLSLEGNTSVSVNVGGLTLSNGYVRTYQTTLTPNEPVVINTEIVFFDKVEGAFEANPNPINLNNIPVMHVSDVTLNTEDSSEYIGNIIGINYSFTNDIKSSFYINSELDQENIAPNRVFFGIKEARIEIVTDSMNATIPIYGQPKVGAIVSLSTPDGSTSESIVCSGQLLAKSISTSVNQSIQNKLSIVTNNLRERMAITSFAPENGTFYDVINIYGEGFDLVNSVYFGDKESNATTSNFPVTILSDNHMQVGVPVDAMTSPIRLRSIYGDIVIAGTDFTINAPEPTITSSSAFSPNGNQTKDYVITIEGLNFHRPSRVLVGDDVASFVRPRNQYGLIFVRPPEQAVNSYITLYEDDYGYSAVSPNKTMFPPFAQSIVPSTGKPGDIISLSGRNLSDVSNAYFINTNSNALISCTATPVNDTGVLLTVPSGNINYSDIVLGYGPLSYSQITEESVTVLNANFWPSTTITGFHPPRVAVGQTLRISGVNFQSDLMYSSSSDVEGSLYDVYFNGVRTTFRRISDTLMTGYVPTTASTGPVGIRANHSTFRLFSNGNLSVTIRGLPSVTRVYKKIFPFEALDVTYGQPINGVIEGTNFENVSTIRFEGVNGAAAGDTFDITSSSHFTVDPNGKKIVLHGYSTLGKDLGDYDISLLNDVGWGEADSDNRLTISDVFNLATIATAKMDPSHRISPTLYGPEKIKDGILDGSIQHYSAAVSNVGSNRYVLLEWDQEVSIHGYKIYAASDPSHHDADALVVTIKNAANDTVYTLDLGTVAASESKYYGTDITPVQGKYFYVYNKSTQILGVAEVIVY